MKSVSTRSEYQPASEATVTSSVTSHTARRWRTMKPASHSISGRITPRGGASPAAECRTRRGTGHSMSSSGTPSMVMMKLAVRPIDEAQPNCTSPVMSVKTSVRKPSTVVAEVTSSGSPLSCSIVRMAVSLSSPWATSSS